MLDWDDLRFFLAIARHGNLLAAGCELKVAGSTVSRRLSSLEAELGVRLLNRTPKGYVLTLAGEEVRDKAEHLEAETVYLQRSVGNRDDRLAGAVRITCGESIACHLLAPCLPSLYEQYPLITIELTPDSRHLSLSMREADISVRLGPPEQQDVVGRQIGTLEFAVYASAEYLACRGRPDFADGGRGHVRVSQLGDLQDSAQADWFASLASQAISSVQTCSHEAALNLVATNGGVACLARHRADQDYRLVRLVTPDRPPSALLWLVMHRDNRRIPRMRAVADHITSHAKSLALSAKEKIC